LTNNAVLHSNNVDSSSTINSNNISNAVISENLLFRTSVINSNTMTFGFIVRNRMHSSATIASNTISASGGSIASNNMEVAYIQNNIISGPNSDIAMNNLFFPETRIGINERSSIQNNTLSGSTCRINFCTLQYNARIQNVIMSTNNLKVNYLTIDNEYVDLNNVPLLRNYQYNEIVAKQRFFIFNVVFNGGAGSGLIGSITLPNYPIATGFYIDSLEVDVNGGLTGVGGIINLGIGTDAPQSGLNDTTGVIATLNSAGITRIQNTTFTKATALRNIVMEVKGANITAGTLGVRVNLNKF
jgi:hypothetical protein